MDRTIQPGIQPLRDLNIALPERSVLPNGVPLTVIDAGEQEVVRLDILFAGGRWQQSQKLQALFTNRMLREGTARYTAAVLAEKLDYYGSWLELSNTMDYAYITVYSLNKYFAKTLEVVESMVKEPLFPEKELQTILDTNLQQFRVNASKVDFQAHRGMLKTLFGDKHPAGLLVMEDDYHAITPEVLRDFYQRFYHSGHCSVYLSGRVSAEIRRQVADTFGAPFGQHTQRQARPTFAVETSADKRIFIERKDAMQSAVKMGQLSITRNHEDYPRLRVLMTLFGGYFGSRLMSNIREEKGYTYGISAGLMFYPDNGLLMISTETANEYVEPLIQEVYNEIDRLHQELVSEEEMTIVRNYMLGEMCRSYESPFSLADAWMFVDTSGVKADYFARSLQAVNEVTAEEIRDLAQRYLCKQTLKEVIAGKKMS